MRFRQLKKLDFVMYFDLSESYFVNYKGKLTEHIRWEYDNGLYVNSGIDRTKGKYKELRRLIKETKSSKYHPMQYWINIGKCHRCGQNLTDYNFKFDNSRIERYFEYDYFYCNSCKEEQVRDFERICLELEECEVEDEKL